MAQNKDAVTLVSPDGRDYTTSSKVEITRLKAHGYTEKKAAAPKKAAQSDKS